MLFLRLWIIGVQFNEKKMKKSKFLQNSKDMLSRSFNPAKCKTSLKLAASRLKLLRNKKEVQVRQMKRELAQLLESGNIQTARIRVEHVVREEKMMAAYDLIEIYCELVVARMPIIESQKNCPIDLKEAITSLIFASPRCGDVPELLEVRKHFTAKYGKDFTTAAVELRPECGVSRMLVEKLSAIAPDGQTKIKILSAIAKEHNVKWDPNTFGEKDGTTPNDLLNGPSTIENSNMYAGAPRFEAPHSQSPHVDNKTHSSSLNFSEQDPRSSVGTHNSTSSQSFGVSSTLESEVRPPVRDERVQSIHEDANAFSKKRWTMDFKDATSAAQAAAESAELASMAARAAAELSSQGRITRQYSTESHMSDVHFSRHDRPEKSTSKLSGENFPDNSANMSSGHSRLKNEAVDQVGHDHLKTAAGRFSEDGYGSTKEFSQSASLRSKTSINDSLDHDVRVVEGYSRKNSLKEEADNDEMNMKRNNEGEVNMKRQSVNESKSANGWHEKYENYPEERLRKQTSRVSSSHSSNFSDENDFANSYDIDSTNEWQEKSENFPEERIRKQHSHVSSHSHSSIFRDENIFANSEHQKFGYDSGEDTTVGIGKGRFDQGASQTSPHDLTSAVFDKSDSESDEYGFNMDRKYDEPELEVHFSSAGKKSAKHSPIKQDAWSPRTSSIKLVENSNSSLFFTEDHTSPEFPDNFVPVTFDDSDSDEHIDKFDHIGTKDSTSIQNEIPQSVKSSFEERKSEGKQWSLYSDDKFKSEHMDMFNPNETKDSINLPSRQSKSSESVRSSFKEQKYSGSDRKHRLLFPDDEVKFEELHGENNQEIKFDAASPKKFNSRKSFADHPSPGPENFKLDSEDTGNGLNFGKLTGGFRHKGNNPPPYSKSRLDNPLSLKKTVEEIVPGAAESSRLSTTLDDEKSMRRRDPHPHLDTDSSEEEMSQNKTSGHRRESYIRSTGNAVKKKPGFGPTVSVFGSDNSDSDEDLPKESLNRKSHLQSGISRRTKASYKPDSDSGKGRKLSTSSSTETPQESQSQTRNSDNNRENLKQPNTAKVISKSTSPETRLDSYSGIERRPSTSYNTETPRESRSQTRREILEQPTSAKVASKTMNSSFSRAQARPASTTMQEPKIFQKSSGIEQPSSSQPKKEVLDSRENEKTTLSKTSSNNEDNARKASHVHPKLPDYDTVAAKLLSLRQNRH